MTDILQHHDAAEIAAYIDGTLSPSARTALEAHLALAVNAAVRSGKLIRSCGEAPSKRGGRCTRSVWLLPPRCRCSWFRPPGRHSSTRRQSPGTGGDGHRGTEADLAARSIPMLEAIEWSSVPGADRYSVTVFDENGGVLWQTEVTDTVARSLRSAAVPGRAIFLVGPRQNRLGSLGGLTGDGVRPFCRGVGPGDQTDPAPAPPSGSCRAQLQQLSAADVRTVAERGDDAKLRIR